MEEGELVCRDTPRGSQRGYLPEKQSHFPAGCVGGGRQHLRGDAHICLGDERVRAAMVKDGAGSSSNGVMPLSRGGSVLVEIPTQQLLYRSKLQ